MAYCCGGCPKRTDSIQIIAHHMLRQRRYTLNEELFILIFSCYSCTVSFTVATLGNRMVQVTKLVSRLCGPSSLQVAAESHIHMVK